MHLDQIYREHETGIKRQYASRVLEEEQATFTPLVFSTTGGMAAECKRYHSRLAKLLATKKGESYSTTMSWIRARVSFALLRSQLLCLRGSRAGHHCRTLTLTWREDMQIFVANIKDDILFLTFYRFSCWISIFEANILHPNYRIQFLRDQC